MIVTKRVASLNTMYYPTKQQRKTTSGLHLIEQHIEHISDVDFHNDVISEAV